MTEQKRQMERGPELENEVLTETVRRLPKQGVWHCGTRRFSLAGGEEAEGAVILAAAGEKKERLLTLSSADDGEYDGLLNAFAQELVLRGEGPQEICAGDELSEEILGRFCRTVGITLKREKDLAVFRETEWQSEHPEAGLKGAETDPFFRILMQLRDEEFARMPRDLAERLLEMSEKGLAPKKLEERIRALCKA
jgi:hypothetical protein